MAYARCHNVIHRHSDVLDIATLADFCGNIWSSNALMIPTPIHSGECYLMPVGAIMALGYSMQEAKRALASATGTVEEMVKLGLKNLMKG